MKAVTFRLQVYNVWVIGLLGWPKPKAEAYLKRRYGTPITVGRSDGSMLQLDNGDVVIHMHEWKGASRDLGLLVHEVVHAALHIMEWIGQGVCTKDHEHLAYLQQFIFQRLIEGKRRDSR